MTIAVNHKDVNIVKRILMIVGGLTLLAVFGCFAITTMGLWSFGSAVNEAQSAPGGSPETAASIGEPITVDDLQYQVLEATTASTLVDSDGLFEDMTTQGQFVVVRYSVTNTGSSTNSVWLLTLQDDQDRSYTSTTAMEGFYPDDEQCLFETLNPGMSSTCTMYFETPTGTHGLMLHIANLGIASGYIDLGLD